jgi:hypothetical protein
MSDAKPVTVHIDNLTWVASERLLITRSRYLENLDKDWGKGMVIIVEGRKRIVHFRLNTYVIDEDGIGGMWVFKPVSYSPGDLTDIVLQVVDDDYHA